MTTEEIIQLARNFRQEATLEEVQEVSPLGIGSKRFAVLASDEVVAKIPWRDRGIWENAAEAALWEWAPEELRALLAPVRDLRGGVLWQDRCRPASENPELLRELARWGISDSAANLGELRGKIVCYDYAYFGEELYHKIAPGIAKNEQNGLLDI